MPSQQVSLSDRAPIALIRSLLESPRQLSKRGPSISPEELAARAGIGLVLAAAISLVAMRARDLSPDGAAAAIVLGTVCAAAGWDWAFLLLVMFLAGTAVSRFRSPSKNVRVANMMEKGGQRDAAQVLANGGLLAIAAAGSIVDPSPYWFGIGAGAIAASAADTFATEIGTLVTSLPRSIVSGQPVATGESGGVTLQGTCAALGGATVIAAAALIAQWPHEAIVGAVAGGFSGAMIDSVLGATVQMRRWCSRCGRETERRVHGCGANTLHSRGFAWLDNDGVNALSSLGGGIIGMLFLL